jgi:hypothetical protein
LVEGFTRRTFTAMIEGIREPAIAAGLIDPERFDAGVRDLRRTTEADGVFCYTFFKGVLCGIGTDYACPDPRVPAPLTDKSAHVTPKGEFVAPNGLPVQVPTR